MEKLLIFALCILGFLLFVMLVLGIVYLCGELVKMIIELWEDFRDGEW